MKKFVAVLIFLTLIIAGMTAYTLRIEAYNVDTMNEIFGAEIWRGGIFTGRLTPYSFVDAEFVSGAYSVQDSCYINWLPAEVTFNAITATVTFKFYGVNICPETTPVELSSFTATLTAQNRVRLAWISQSEMNMLGYRVYRNDSNYQAGSIMITPTLIPAYNTSTTQTYTITDDEVEIGHTYYYWLESVDMGSSQFHGPVSVIVEGEVPPVYPVTSSIKNAYPNPFKANSNTNIEVSIKEGETGSVTIYNVLGQVVKTFSVPYGTHTINWNGQDNRGNTCGSGIYFYSLNTPSINQTKKLVIVK
ncbi:MAG: T9SS type A sorting domain-containing protein [Candidatus Syntrophosphaera sp.]|nr:T9SS type A sorting domain-containing protein [Candidatus Syntrophosphaera sp.]